MIRYDKIWRGADLLKEAWLGKILLHCQNHSESFLADQRACRSGLSNAGQIGFIEACKIHNNKDVELKIST